MKSALILEDHPDCRHWLEGILQEAFPGISIDGAESLARGRALLAKVNYDLAILDISLPDGDGTALLKQIRASCAATYVVMATIFDDDEHLFTALKEGAHGFLLKDQPRGRLVE